MASASKGTDWFRRAERPTGGMKSWIIMGAVSVVAGLAGFAAPQMLTGGPQLSPMLSGGAARDSTRMTAVESAGYQSTFIPFCELAVNLADDRLTRRLRVTIALEIDELNEEFVKVAVERKKTILKNWLISYLSDKTLDDVRGAAGVNKARREILDQFNSLSFADGSKKIRDVLFEEFSVQ